MPRYFAIACAFYLAVESAESGDLGAAIAFLTLMGYVLSYRPK